MNAAVRRNVIACAECGAVEELIIFTSPRRAAAECSDVAVQSQRIVVAIVRNADCLRRAAQSRIADVDDFAGNRQTAVRYRAAAGIPKICAVVVVVGCVVEPLLVSVIVTLNLKSAIVGSLPKCSVVFVPSLTV